MGFFTYDAPGRPLTAKGADGKAWNYERGAFSQVHRRVSAYRLPSQTHSYEPQGRVTEWFAPPPVGEPTTAPVG